MDLAALHDNSSYFDHPYFEQRRTDVRRMEQRCRHIGARLGQAALARIRGSRHLDIGCDTGLLLSVAARFFGTTPVGIDIARRAVQIARADGLEVYHSDLPGIPELTGFGLITIIDVLEHVPDPRTFLADVSRRLMPGGFCYIETPNVGSIVYRIGRFITNLTGGRPAWLCERLFLPEHVQYISDYGFDALASAAGLQIRARGYRPLSFADVNSALPVRIGVAALQSLDRVSGSQLLHWVVLEKSASGTGDQNPSESS
jgi:SAM-dependent methyltransferase